MREPSNVFHLAIPCKCLKETRHFYNKLLGCKIAREYEDRVTIDFFGDQIVCHLASDKIDENPSIYPRHFGITFKDLLEYENLLKLVRERGVKIFKDEFIRFEGKIEEHKTFFLIDPSNNLLEFKYYFDSRMMY